MNWCNHLCTFLTIKDLWQCIYQTEKLGKDHSFPKCKTYLVFRYFELVQNNAIRPPNKFINQGALCPIQWLACNNDKDETRVYICLRPLTLDYLISLWAIVFFGPCLKGEEIIILSYCCILLWHTWMKFFGSPIWLPLCSNQEK